MKGWDLFKFWFDFVTYVVAEMLDSEKAKKNRENRLP